MTKRLAIPIPYKEASPKAINKQKSQKNQQQRNKLSKRDLTRLTTTVKRARGTKERYTFKQLAEVVNDTKSPEQQVAASTVWNHKAEANLACAASRGNWPGELMFKDLPQWLRNRRGFCKLYKSCDKTGLVMSDESFFGLRRKTMPHKKYVHPVGGKQIAKYVPQPRNKRVVVWAAMGLNYVGPLVIKEDGVHFNSDTYIEFFTPLVLPWLQRYKNKMDYWEDGATYHTSVATTAAFDARGIKRSITGGYWKDLNYMEKVWANMKDEIYKGGKEYESKIELIAAIKSTWKRLTSDPKYRSALLWRFEKACQKCLDAQGYYVNW